MNKKELGGSLSLLLFFLIVVGQFAAGAQPIDISLDLDKRLASPGDTVTVSGRALYSNRTPVADTEVRVWLDGVLISQVDDPWPTHQHDANHTGATASQAPAFPPTPKTWHFSTSTLIAAEPIVGPGLVYFGDIFGRVYAVERYTGKLVWQFNVPGGTSIESAFALSEDTLIVVVTNNAYALDANSGSPKWSLPITGESRQAHPTIHQGVVYFGTRASSPLQAFVYAAYINNGTLFWSKTLPTTSTGDLQSSPAVQDGALYIGAFDSVFKLDTSNGNILWQKSIGGASRIRSSPTLVGNSIYIGSATTNTVYALDKANGNILWSSVPLSGQIEATPAYSDGVLYIATGVQDKKLYALNTSTGAILWEVLIVPSPSSPTFSSPVIAEDKVYLGLVSPAKIKIFNKSSGAFLGEYPILFGTAAPTPIANGVLYFGTAGSGPITAGLYAFGRPLENTSTSDQLTYNRLAHVGDFSSQVESWIRSSTTQELFPDTSVSQNFSFNHSFEINAGGIDSTRFHYSIAFLPHRDNTNIFNVSTFIWDFSTNNWVPLDFFEQITTGTATTKLCLIREPLVNVSKYGQGGKIRLSVNVSNTDPQGVGGAGGIDSSLSAGCDGEFDGSGTFRLVNAYFVLSRGVTTNNAGKYTFTFRLPDGLIIGDHTLKVNITDPAGILGENSTILKVRIIRSISPPSPVSDFIGAQRAFTVTLGQVASVTWLLNGTVIQSNVSVTEATYTNLSAARGEYNLTVVVTNPNGTDTEKWVWRVSNRSRVVQVGLDVTEPFFDVDLDSQITVNGSDMSATQCRIYRSFVSVFDPTQGDACSSVGNGQFLCPANDTPEGNHTRFISCTNAAGLNETVRVDWTTGNLGEKYRLEATPIPSIVNLQGRVTYTNGTPIANGSMRITVFDPTGAEIFQDTFNNSIFSGSFNVALGAKKELLLLDKRVYSVKLEVDTESETFISADVTFGTGVGEDVIKFQA